MHVLYFHQHFSTPQGSTGTRSYEFARKLIERGHSVTIVCGSYWIADSGLSGGFVNGIRSGYVSGIKVIELELQYSNTDSFIRRTLIFLRYSWQGLKIGLKEKYDILFATSTPLTAGIPGIIARLLRKKPFIFEVRDLWPELPKAMGVITNPIILKLMDWLESFTYRLAATCIGLSPGIVKGIKKKVPNKIVVMIPNGCDLNLVEDYKPMKNNTEFVAVFTGAHGIANGLDAVLDAVEILVEKGRQDIVVKFIGDGLLKPKLQERVRYEGLTNCKFLEPMPKNGLFTYLKQNASVGLMILDNVPAFYYGTSPNKFFDYLSLGLPVINNYPGWLAEIITQNQCGIAVPPDNPEAFADSLIKLKDNPDLREKMGKNGRRLAENEFDRNRLGERFVDVLESVTV
ncbi:MAG: glycosyltransferase family 4 protein [Candidatus Marinimicrobia bacterium]|nr:glycosyltransferase family 4 protein [Candidatus Neomarinimicrobiota bacterium]